MTMTHDAARLDDAEPLTSDTTDEQGVPPVKSLMWRTLWTLSTLCAVAFAVTLTLRGPLAAAGAVFVDTLGLAGLFAGVLLLDTVPGTLHEPLMVLGYAGGEGFWPVVLTTGSASFLSGVVGWGLGRALGKAAWLQRALRRYHITSFMHHYGVWAVALAALTPFPFAVTTWGAGATGVPLRHVVAGSLLRFPKEIVYFAIYVYGAGLAS